MSFNPVAIKNNIYVIIPEPTDRIITFWNTRRINQTTLDDIVFRRITALQHIFVENTERTCLGSPCDVHHGSPGPVARLNLTEPDGTVIATWMKFGIPAVPRYTVDLSGVFRVTNPKIGRAHV